MWRKQEKNISSWSSLSSMQFIHLILQNCTKSKATQNISSVLYSITALITQFFSFAFWLINIVKLVSKQHKQIATLTVMIIAKSKWDLWGIQSSHLLLLLAPTAKQSRISLQVIYFSIKQTHPCIASIIHQVPTCSDADLCTKTNSHRYFGKPQDYLKGSGGASIWWETVKWQHNEYSTQSHHCPPQCPGEVRSEHITDSCCSWVCLQKSSQSETYGPCLSPIASAP